MLFQRADQACAWKMPRADIASLTKQLKFYNEFVYNEQVINSNEYVNTMGVITFEMGAYITKIIIMRK